MRLIRFEGAKAARREARRAAILSGQYVPYRQCSTAQDLELNRRQNVDRPRPSETEGWNGCALADFLFERSFLEPAELADWLDDFMVYCFSAFPWLSKALANAPGQRLI
jgi:hypothetical protein